MRMCVRERGGGVNVCACVHVACVCATPTKRGEMANFTNLCRVYGNAHMHTDSHAHAQCATWERMRILWRGREGEFVQEQEQTSGKKTNNMDPKRVHITVKRGERWNETDTKVMTKKLWGFWLCRIWSNVDELNNQVVGEFRSQNAVYKCVWCVLRATRVVIC